MTSSSSFSTTAFWQRLLLVLVPVLMIAIFLLGNRPLPAPDGFPSPDEMLAMLRNRHPALFFQELERRIGSSRGSLNAVRALWKGLDEAVRRGSGADQISADAIRGALLVRLGYLERGRIELERAAAVTMDEDERTAALLLLVDADRRLGDRAGAASAAEQLREIDGAAADLDLAIPELDVEPGLAQFISISSDSAALGSRSGNVQDGYLPIWKLSLWLVLLFLPFTVVEMERRKWLRTWPNPTDNRSRPFVAFRRSPLTPLLSIGSALAVFVLRLPGSGILFEGPLFASLHLVVAFLLAQIPHLRLDREVRGSTWSFFTFLGYYFRIGILSSAHLLMLLPTVIILRYMTIFLPMWPVFSPHGPALALSTLTAAFFLFWSFFWPRILWLSRISSGNLPEWAISPSFFSVPLYLWRLPGSGLPVIASFGSLSFLQGVVVSEHLLRVFSGPVAAATAIHEVAHLRLGHRFLAFVAFLDALLLIGLFIVLRPLVVQRFLLLGPTPMQPVVLFFAYLVFSHLMGRLNGIMEMEADRFTAEHCGRNVTLTAISRLDAAQMLPERRREGEGNGVHSSPVERKRLLLAQEGEYLEPFLRPDPALLVALWRSRLALDWKLGEVETIHLCALDFEVPPGSPLQEQFRALGKHHVAFGGEALIAPEKRVPSLALSPSSETFVGDTPHREDTSEKSVPSTELCGCPGEKAHGVALEILWCAQKSAARGADPSLPVDKICRLCSKAMQSGLSSRTEWEETPEGCKLQA
ncbi:MAG: hypothetical protein WA705_26760 [Candidatus Ozemobacteraceae bacterium]